MDMKSFAIVTSGLLSDGSNTDKVLYFNNTDYILIKYFKEAFKKIFDIDNEKFGGNWEKAKEHDIKRIYICSKDLVNKLKCHSPTFTTKPKYVDNKKIYPNCRIPEIILKSMPRIKNEFIRMYASCDGDVEIHLRYVSKEKRYDPRGNVCIIVENPPLRKQILAMLITLGYSPTLEEGRIRICKKRDIIKYAQEIGFMDGCKISNSNPHVHFYWHKKNDILSLLVYLIQFGIPKNLSKVNKSKQNKKNLKGYLSNLLNKIERKEKLDYHNYKQRRNFLNDEEKKWILGWKNKKGKKLILNNNTFKVTTVKIAEMFKDKFSKEIDNTTIFWYWKNK